MAKNSLFWGKASGKLGEIVLYRSGGEQRSRTYVKNVKNPKSLAQMEQRIKMASLVGFFKSLRGVLRSSFPQRNTNQSGFNAFMAASLPVASTAISKSAADEGLSVPLGYAVSRGDILLPAGAFAAPVLKEGVEIPLDGALQFLPYGAGAMNEIETLDAPVPEQISEAMQGYLNYYPELDAQLPAKFNLVIVSSTYVDEGFKQEYAVYRFDRTGGSLRVTTPGSIAFRSGVWPLAVATVAAGKALLIGVNQGDADNGASLAAAFISFTGEDGKIHVSNSNMEVVRDSNGYIDQFKKSGDVYNGYLEDLGYSDSSAIGTR